MSIVRMQKVSAIGLDDCRENLIKQLMDLEVIELTEQSANLADEYWAENVRVGDEQEEAAIYEAKISKAAQALDIIEKYGKLKNPLFKTRRIVSEFSALHIPERNAKTEENIDRFIEINEEIRALSDKVNKLDTDKLQVEPWQGYGLSLEVEETNLTDIILGCLPSASSFEEIEQNIKELSDLLEIRKVYQDKENIYVALITDKSVTEEVLKELREVSFSQLSFKGFNGTAKEVIKACEKEKEELTKQIEDLKNEVKQKAVLKNEIEDYSDMMIIEMDKRKTVSKFLETKRAFFIEGWVPYPAVKKVTEILEENECHFEFRDPEEGENVPVLLKNPDFFSPIEAVTEMYSLPAYGSFDPTSIYALFYVCFFGMMFSDACYGIIMTVICFIVLKKFNLEGTTYKMMRGFLYCGISTFFWGVMFGGWFGNIVSVVSGLFGAEVTIPPVMFDPLDNPLTLLIISIAFGIVHIFIAMGIKSYMQIKDGHWFDALCDQGFWYMIIIGLIWWLAGGTIGIPTAPGMWVTIVGAAGVLFTAGRYKKGFGKVTGGLLGLYDVTSYVSDILSYTRILALGLATGVIGQVVNLMGSLLGKGIAGLIFLGIVFVVGHVLNFAINVLGAFIHASRLQYVEFFGKFYEDGGDAFMPLKKNTKFIKIDKKSLNI